MKSQSLDKQMNHADPDTHHINFDIFLACFFMLNVFRYLSSLNTVQGRTLMNHGGFFLHTLNEIRIIVAYILLFNSYRTQM